MYCSVVSDECVRPDDVTSNCFRSPSCPVLSTSISISLSVCLSVCLFLSVRVTVCVYVCVCVSTLCGHMSGLKHGVGEMVEPMYALLINQSKIFRVVQVV